jgi:type I restriction enzyme, S subunit
VSKWEKVRLGDVAFVNPPRPKELTQLGNGDISFVPMSLVSEDGDIDTSNSRPINEVDKGFTYFKEEDVLFAKITPCMENGKGAIARNLVNGLGAGSTEFHVIRPIEGKTSSEWIFWFLRNKNTRLLAEKNMTGSAGQKRVPKAFLENVLIPLPTLDNQEQIVHELSTISGLIILRKLQLEDLDQLNKSVFYEMFGDPVLNEKGWGKEKVERLVSAEPNSIKAGPFGSALKKENYVERGYKIYGQEQVIRNDITFGDYYINGQKYLELKNYAVKENDVLISLVGTYGKLLIIPHAFEPGIINPRLMKISFDQKLIDPRYFKRLFESERFKDVLATQSRGGTMDILNVGIVKNLEIIVPPIELQNQFAEIVTQIETQKALVKQSIDETQRLFDSLMSKYFDD